MCCKKGIEECTWQSGGVGAFVFVDWRIVFAKSVVRRKGNIALGEFGIWVVTLKGVQNVAVLIQGVVGGHAFEETIGWFQRI